MKDSRGRVSISSETRPVYFQSIYAPKHFGLGLEIRTVELCGSDKWEIDLHEE